MAGKGRGKRKAAKRPAEYLSSGLVVHGAFTTRGAAERKKSKLGRDAFVVRKLARWGGGSASTRYCVFTRDGGADFSF